MQGVSSQSGIERATQFVRGGRGKDNAHVQLTGMIDVRVEKEHAQSKGGETTR